MGLLIEAAYHVDLNISRQKWRCWKENNPDLDAIDWQSARVISQVAPTLYSRGIESTNLAARQGVRQFEWALFENHLANFHPFLSALVEAEIPIMMSKGAAIHLSGIYNEGTRLMADLDILVEPAQIDNVMDVAERLGWKCKWDMPRIELRDCLQSSRHSVPLSNGEKWEIDLHTSAFLLNRCPDHDASMWTRGKKVRIGDVEVLVSSTVDMLAVTLGHGLLFNPRPIGIWVCDAVALIENGAIDWDLFLDVIEHRDIAVFAYAGLAYISQVLGRSVPGYVLTRLASRLCEPFLGEFLGHVKSWDATSRTIRQSWGAAAAIRATKWQSRMTSPWRAFLAAISRSWITTRWQDADHQSSTRFIIEIPDELHNLKAQSVLEIKFIPDRPDIKNQLSLALTCFDHHICELDHRDYPTDYPADEKSLAGRYFRFRVDTAIIQAYSLRSLGLELLVPGTLDASPVSANAVSYRWCT